MTDRALSEAYAQVTRLEPLSASATPRAKQTLGKVHRLVSLMYMHTSGLMTASGVDEDENWAEPDDNDAAVAKTGVTVEERVAQIRASVDLGSIASTAWLAYVLQPGDRKGTLLEGEQDGFARLVRGYRRVGTDCVEQHLEGDGALTEIGERSCALEANDDVVARLHGRETLMEGSESADAAYGFVMSVLRTMHGIKFALEWAELSQAGKAQFREDAFRRMESKMTFGVFQHRHEKLIKARNDLKKLFFKFGTRVLMDPYWAPHVSYETGRTGRSPTFPATLKIVLSDAVEAPTEDALLESERAFRELVHPLAETQAMAFIHQFLTST